LKRKLADAIDDDMNRAALRKCPAHGRHLASGNYDETSGNYRQNYFGVTVDHGVSSWL
jgi:hypothetical protein